MTIRDILDEFGTNLKEDLQKELLKKGVETNGGQNSRLGASIRFFFTNDGQTLNLGLNDYYEAVDKGRGENKKNPPITPILNWIKRKGITFELSTKRKALIKGTKNKTVRKGLKQMSLEKKRLGLAFGISKSIGKHGTIKRFGYHGANFFDTVVKDGRIEKLKKDLSEVCKQEIKIAINGNY
jgi:hypothetical protein